MSAQERLCRRRLAGGMLTVVVPEELRTGRLRLRRWRDADLEPFAALNADPVVMEHFPAPLTREQSDAMVARIEETFGREGYGLWAVEVGATGAFAGFVGSGRPPSMPPSPLRWRSATAWPASTGVRTTPPRPPGPRSPTASSVWGGLRSCRSPRWSTSPRSA